MTTQHTPGPYVVGTDTDRGQALGRVHVLAADSDGLLMKVATAITLHDAEHIVRALNSHADLLAALRECETAFERKAICDCDWHMGLQHKPNCPRGAMLRARAAIARVEGNT